MTQLLQFADVGGLDGQYLCAKLINVSNVALSLPFISSRVLQSACPSPPPIELDLTGFFPKPIKPAGAVAPPPSGKRVRVLHVSDFHLDPRYTTGAESSCASGLCCRPNLTAANPPPGGGIEAPAPRYGAYGCDLPYQLAGSFIQAIPELAGEDGKFDWAIFTGDLYVLSSSFSRFTYLCVSQSFPR